MLRNTLNNRAITLLRMSSTVAILLAGMATAQGHETKTSFEMIVVSDAAYGKQIKSGQTALAIEKIEATPVRSSQKFFAKNNLCVAYTMTGDFAKAMAECNAAIETIQAQATFLDDLESVINARYTAMALSNRGVLQAMLGETDLARSDFEKAKQLPVRNTASRRNLEHLNVRTAQASAR